MNWVDQVHFLLPIFAAQWQHLHNCGKAWGFTLPQLCRCCHCAAKIGSRKWTWSTQFTCFAPTYRMQFNISQANASATNGTWTYIPFSFFALTDSAFRRHLPNLPTCLWFVSRPIHTSFLDPSSWEWPWDHCIEASHSSGKQRKTTSVFDIQILFFHSFKNFLLSSKILDDNFGSLEKKEVPLISPFVRQYLLDKLGMMYQISIYINEPKQAAVGPDKAGTPRGHDSQLGVPILGIPTADI